MIGEIIYISAIATSITFLVNYYLPAVEKVKKKFKKTPKSLEPGRLVFLIIINLIVYTLLSPLVLLTMLISNKALKEKLETKIMNDAVLANLE